VEVEVHPPAARPATANVQCLLALLAVLVLQLLFPLPLLPLHRLPLLPPNPRRRRLPPHRVAHRVAVLQNGVNVEEKAGPVLNAACRVPRVHRKVGTLITRSVFLPNPFVG